MTKPKTPKAKPELLDPRQALFLELYLNPKSKTFSNIYQSAIKAGYSKNYATDINSKVSWVEENRGEVTKGELVTKAKKVLNKSLDSQDERLAQDTAKFIAKSEKEFSDKVDVDIDHKLEINVVSYADTDTPQLHA